MKLIILLLLSSVSSVHALETDNYLVWGKTLPDAGEEVNEYFRTQIVDVLSSTTAEEDLSCENVTYRIGARFRTAGSTRKLYENWSVEHLTEKIFPSTSFYLEQSIYRHTYRFYLGKSGLSPNLQVNGFYFGVDKISHFASTGRRYLKKYLEKLADGMTPEEAEKAAIRYGLANEASILGLWPTGVFSYGDMEANYQGFRFYKRLCLDQQNTYLKKVDGLWKLVQAPNIREYVTPYWDETFNLSYRSKGMWAIASQVILEEYCPLKDGPEVQGRFKHYTANAVKSPSRAYIEELQASGYKQAPIPTTSQSIDELCSKRNL